MSELIELSGRTTGWVSVMAGRANEKQTSGLNLTGGLVPDCLSRLGISGRETYSVRTFLQPSHILEFAHKEPMTSHHHCTKTRSENVKICKNAIWGRSGCQLAGPQQFCSTQCFQILTFKYPCVDFGCAVVTPFL